MLKSDLFFLKGGRCSPWWWAAQGSSASVGGSMAPSSAGTPPTLTSTPTTPMVSSVCVFRLWVCRGYSHWRLSPPADPSVLRGELSGHTDSVWGLVYSGVHQRLLSCSADGTVRLWDASTTSPALAVFNENQSADLIDGHPLHSCLIPTC